MPYVATTRPQHSSRGTTLGHLPAQQLHETLLMPRQAVLGSIKASGEELRTASRLLDPKEPFNRNMEHLKTIALITATDQLANLDPTSSGLTTGEPKRITTYRHRAPNRTDSTDKPRHARFVDVRNGKAYDLPTPVVTDYRGWAPYDGSDKNSVNGVPWFPPAAGLAHLSFDERLEVLRIHHDRCRRYWGDSASTHPKHERVMFDRAWKSGERKAELNAQFTDRQEPGIYQAKSMENERHGREPQRRPSSVDPSRAKCHPSSRPRQVHFVGSPIESPPPGLVRRYTEKFEGYSSSGSSTHSSDSSLNTSFELTNTSFSSRTSLDSGSTPLKPAVHLSNAPSLATRIEYYHEVASGPPVPREGVTDSWVMDMLRAKLHRTLGYNLCINAGIEPEMAALIAVSLDKPMVPEGVSERYSAVRKWEAELAEEQERRADVGYELEKEWALREERVATRAQGRKRESRHGRQPACGDDSLSPGADPCPYQVHGTHPRTLCTPSSPNHQYKQPKHLMETTVSPLKRSGALSTPHRPNRTTEASPQVMKAGIRSWTMGI